MIDKKTKQIYLQEFVSLSASWLHHKEAESEYNYLLSRLPNKKDIELFNFGYFPKSYPLILEFLDQFSEKINADPVNALKECNIIYVTEKYNKIVSFFRHHHLLIPFYDVYNLPVSIVGRTLLNDNEMKLNKISKYKHLPFEKRRHLYGLNLSYKNIIKRDYAIVVEGQFDFISGLLSGIDNIIALGGAKFTFEHIILLKRFTNNFYVLLDNDEAGESGIDKIQKSQQKYSIRVNALKLPDGYKDLDDYLKINKMKDIREFIVKPSL